MRSSPCWRPAPATTPPSTSRSTRSAANLTDYITGFETPADRAANAVAKTLLLEEVSGADVSAGIDLEADLRGLMETDGRRPRVASPTPTPWASGNFANGIGQALAILALDRTAGGVPTEAVDYLLDQQCSDGSFRLYQFGYVLEFGPPPVTVDDALVRGPGGGRRGRDGVRAAGAPRGAVVHRGVGRRVRRRRLPARSAAGVRAGSSAPAP